jgi:hypothetical protein
LMISTKKQLAVSVEWLALKPNCMGCSLKWLLLRC